MGTILSQDSHGFWSNPSKVAREEKALPSKDGTFSRGIIVNEGYAVCAIRGS